MSLTTLVLSGLVWHEVISFPLLVLVLLVQVMDHQVVNQKNLTIGTQMSLKPQCLQGPFILWWFTNVPGCPDILSVTSSGLSSNKDEKTGGYVLQFFTLILLEFSVKSALAVFSSQICILFYILIYLRIPVNAVLSFCGTPQFLPPTVICEPGHISVITSPSPKEQPHKPLKSWAFPGHWLPSSPRS